jgi:hypothetical protein
MTAKPKRRPGPKFRVGQVVNAQGVYLGIERILPDSRYDLGTLIHWHEAELRPLTAREIGPRPKRRSKGTK